MEEIRTTTTMVWAASGIIALVDGVMIRFLSRRLKIDRFCDLKWSLLMAAAIFWSLLSLTVVRIFWDSYYRAFYPLWFRSGGLLIWVPMLYGALSMLLYQVSCHFPRNPILVFCFSGGVLSILEHLWGVYGYRILEIPLLQGVSPAAILGFGFVEYIFYWLVVLGFADLLSVIWQRRKSR